MVTALATDTGASAGADPDGWSPPTFEPDTVAFLQYTSGSTSDPKGVMVTHGNLLHNAEEIKHCVHGTSQTIGVGWIPHYHDMCLIGQVISPLYLGCNYVFTSPITFLKRPVLWLELISRHRATNTVAPNFGYELLLRRVTDRDMAGLDLSCLRTAQNGAEPIRPDTLERVLQRFGPIGFRPDSWAPCYGMAETTLLITGTPAGRGPISGNFDTEALTQNKAIPITDPYGQRGRRLVSSGRPISLDVRIVDPHTHAVLPDGHVGEIWVRGGSVTKGYWRRPEQTRDTFHAVTADGAGSYLRTGDLGFLTDGELYVTGRIKDLIIINGCNIYAHDIEHAALCAHRAIRTAAAFSADTSTQAGPGAEQVILVLEISISAANGTTPAALTALTEHAVNQVFQLPALSVVLCARGAIQRTTSGKIQRRLTRQAFLDGKITAIHELAGHPTPGTATPRPMTQASP